MTLHLGDQDWNSRACIVSGLECMGESGWGFYMFMRVLGKLLTSEYLFKALSICHITFGWMTKSLV